MRLCIQTLRIEYMAISLKQTWNRPDPPTVCFCLLQWVGNAETIPTRVVSGTNSLCLHFLIIFSKPHSQITMLSSRQWNSIKQDPTSASRDPTTPPYPGEASCRRDKQEGSSLNSLCRKLSRRAGAWILRGDVWRGYQKGWSHSVRMGNSYDRPFQLYNRLSSFFLSFLLLSGVLLTNEHGYL